MYTNLAKKIKICQHVARLDLETQGPRPIMPLVGYFLAVYYLDSQGLNFYEFTSFISMHIL